MESIRTQFALVVGVGTKLMGNDFADENKFVPGGKSISSYVRECKKNNDADGDLSSNASPTIYAKMGQSTFTPDLLPVDSSPAYRATSAMIHQGIALKVVQSFEFSS